MSEERLYTKCELCNGIGEWNRPSERTGTLVTNFGLEQCPKCDGFGMIFSSVGKEVVDIILQLRRIGRLN